MFQGDFRNWRTLSRVLCKVPVTGKLEKLASTQMVLPPGRVQISSKAAGLPDGPAGRYGGKWAALVPSLDHRSSFCVEPLRLEGCLPLKCPKYAPTDLGALGRWGAAPGPLPLFPGPQAASRRWSQGTCRQVPQSSRLSGLEVPLRTASSSAGGVAPCSAPSLGKQGPRSRETQPRALRPQDRA